MFPPFISGRVDDIHASIARVAPLGDATPIKPQGAHVRVVDMRRMLTPNRNFAALLTCVDLVRHPHLGADKVRALQA